MARQIDGIALGAVAAGGLFAYAGIKGYSVPHALQALIQGKPPSTGGQANPVVGSSGSPTGAEFGGGKHIKGPTRAQADWARSILSGIGAPFTQRNILSLTAWALREAPWNNAPPDGAEYTHNPLNTTLAGPGAIGNVNSIGVKIYDNWADGDNATVQTLSGYPAIVAALRSGAGLCGNPSVAADFRRWSGGGYSSVC